MDPRTYNLVSDYLALTARIYTIRHSGQNYSNEEKMAREMLSEIRDKGFAQIGWLEDKLDWALTEPAPSQ